MVYAQVQATTLYLNGVVTDHDTHRPLIEAMVIATDTAHAKMVVGGLVDNRGKFALRLPYDHVFSVEFTAAGKAPKRVLMDLNGPKARARDEGYTMTLEMELFTQLAGVDYSALDEPVAICNYAKRQKEFIWAEEYGQARSPALTALTEAHAAELRRSGQGSQH